MGKRLNALLGRNTKASKLKTLANLATSRIAILKNQRNVRCSHARSDVIQLLNLNHQERALLRVEHVINEQNMLDVFVMIENYCHLLMERVVLLKNNRECPDELKEAISSLIFASSRCGEFPELQQIREILTSGFGKEFAVDAVELRNNCGVNPKMIRKLSTRQASPESRLEVLKKIASHNGITLDLEDDVPAVITEEEQDVNGKQKQIEAMEDIMSNGPEVGEEIIEDEKCFEPMKARKEYRDVAAAAQDAFESAAYAAVAARAAVDLYRSESWDEEPDDRSSFDRQGIPFNSDDSSKYKDTSSEKAEHFEKIYPIESFNPESQGKEMFENERSRLREFKQRNHKDGPERTLGGSDSDSDKDNSSGMEVNSDPRNYNEPLSEDTAFDESDDENRKKQDDKPWLQYHDTSSPKKPDLSVYEFPKTSQYDEVAEDSFSDHNGYMVYSQSPKWIGLKSQADHMTYPMKGRSRLQNTEQLNTDKHLYLQHSDGYRKPSSVRTRQGHI